MRGLILFCLSLSFMLSAASANAGAIKNRMDELDGLLTRAGVGNQQPLSQTQLVQLCEEGYDHAFFLYDGAGNQTVNCSRGSIRYKSIKVGQASEVLASLLAGVKSHKRTFVHCWNGAHNTNTVAAIALRQFCDLNPEQVSKYWHAHDLGYPLAGSAQEFMIKKANAYPLIQTDIPDSELADYCR